MMWKWGTCFLSMVWLSTDQLKCSNSINFLLCWWIDKLALQHKCNLCIFIKFHWGVFPGMGDKSQSYYRVNAFLQIGILRPASGEIIYHLFLRYIGSFFDLRNMFRVNEESICLYRSVVIYCILSLCLHTNMLGHCYPGFHLCLCRIMGCCLDLLHKFQSTYEIN